MTLDEVEGLAASCGMPHAGMTMSQEIEIMLTFFHSLSTVLWYNEPSLRHLVILDVHWLIDAMTCNGFECNGCAWM